MSDNIIKKYWHIIQGGVGYKLLKPFTVPGGIFPEIQKDATLVECTDDYFAVFLSGSEQPLFFRLGLQTITFLKSIGSIEQFQGKTKL